MTQETFIEQAYRLTLKKSQSRVKSSSKASTSDGKFSDKTEPGFDPATNTLLPTGKTTLSVTLAELI